MIRAKGSFATTVPVFVLSAYYLGSAFQLARRTFWTRGLGDWIDPYFINFLLEHWYRSLSTFTDPSSPPMFAPIRGTLGYSHGLVLYAPFYFVLRPFFHPFQSYGLMLFVVLEIGVVSLYLVLRLAFRLSFVEALLLSAFFLTSRNVLSGLMGVWSQRGSVFLIPPILLLVFVSQRTSAAGPRAVLASLSGLLSTLLFTQDFYTGALALLVALLGFVPLAVVARPPVVAELTARRWLVPFAVGATAGALIFMWLYLPAYREHPAFSEDQVIRELVSRGISEFKQKHYAEARVCFEQACAADRGVLDACREPWAYCIIDNVSKTMEQPGVLPAKFPELQKQVEGAIEMAPGNVMAVDGQGGTGQCPRAERQYINPLAALLQAFTVTAEHLVVGEQVMRQEHGLGALEMGVPGHHYGTMAFGETGELLLQSAKQLLNGSDLVAQIQAHIEQDLVVAAAGGMQLAAQGADLLGQPPLDRHVDVFVQRQEGETSLLQFALHAL